MLISKTPVVLAVALIAATVGRPAHAGSPLYGVTSPVYDVYTASGSTSGDNRPCEFFEADYNGTWSWYAIPLVNLGANAQVLKIEAAHQAYLADPNSPNAVITFKAYNPVSNCSGFLQADGIR